MEEQVFLLARNLKGERDLGKWFSEEGDSVKEVCFSPFTQREETLIFGQRLCISTVFSSIDKNKTELYMSSFLFLITVELCTSLGKRFNTGREVGVVQILEGFGTHRVNFLAAC